jgi:hypothetical protein
VLTSGIELLMYTWDVYLQVEYGARFCTIDSSVTHGFCHAAIASICKWSTVFGLYGGLLLCVDGTGMLPNYTPLSLALLRRLL